MLHFPALTKSTLRRKCILRSAAITRSAKNLDLSHSFSWPLRCDSLYHPRLGAVNESRLWLPAMALTMPGTLGKSPDSRQCL